MDLQTYHSHEGGNPGVKVGGGSPTKTFGDDGGKVVVFVKTSKVSKTFEV